MLTERERRESGQVRALEANVERLRGFMSSPGIQSPISVIRLYASIVRQPTDGPRGDGALNDVERRRTGGNMSPVSDLSVLLKTLEPVLNPGVFVFASVKDGNAIDPAAIVASIREPEGLSVVMREADAQISGLNALFKCAWITLTVNSALEAVGLTAAFATALGHSGISCNVVAGACHDHIFVPLESADAAMHVLRSLQT
nr:ACT domain-containing protein [Paraburkholderia sp. BL8N3]